MSLINSISSKVYSIFSISLVSSSLLRALSALIVIDVPPLKSIPSFNPHLTSEKIPTITTKIVAIKNFLLCLIKSNENLVFLPSLYPIKKFNFLSKYPVLTNIPSNILIKNTIIHIVTIVLMISIVANPLTLLSPSINKTKATTNVVRFESKIAIKEFLLPVL